MPISENLSWVRSRIQAAAGKAGRDPDEIMLLAVSKSFPLEAIQEAYNAGQRCFGESKVQEFAGKIQAAQLPEAKFHMIGHLQSNKASKAVEFFQAIDSVDSLKLAEKLNSAAQTLGKELPILLEINVGGEGAKTGISINDPELERILLAAANLSNLRVRGLMTVPPFTEDPEGARPYFQKLRRLRDQIATRQLPSIAMDILSMGMSHDFEVAIEEGSTCVRVGTAIFGERKYAK